MRKRLLAGIILTTTSLVFRAIFLMLSYHVELHRILINDSIKNDTWAYPIFSILWYGFEDIIPITAQIVSIRISIINKRNFSKSLMSTKSLLDASRMEESSMFNSEPNFEVSETFQSNYNTGSYIEPSGTHSNYIKSTI